MKVLKSTTCHRCGRLINLECQFDTGETRKFRKILYVGHDRTEVFCDEVETSFHCYCLECAALREVQKRMTYESLFVRSELNLNIGSIPEDDAWVSKNFPTHAERRLEEKKKSDEALETMLDVLVDEETKRLNRIASNPSDVEEKREESETIMKEGKFKNRLHEQFVSRINHEITSMKEASRSYSAGEVSDGYHTFNELYHHRAILFAVICHCFPDLAWKSRRHAVDDEPMYDGMFIVGINTPRGQATYHYDLEPYWELFDVKELPEAPEWDGHTPAMAIERIRSLIHAH